MSLYGRKPKTKPALWKSMKGGLKPRQPQKANRLEAYRKARAAYLRDCPFCEVCVEIAGVAGWKMQREHAATDIHHTRGRAGKLLTDPRHFKAVCRKAHNWIHAHPALARALGLLAQPGQWNREVAAQQTRLLGPQP